MWSGEKSVALEWYEQCKEGRKLDCCVGRCSIGEGPTDHSIVRDKRSTSGEEVKILGEYHPTRRN